MVVGSLAESRSEVCSKPACGRLSDPRLEGLAPAFPHERQKRLAQRIGVREGVIHLAELVDRQPGVRRPLRFRAPPGE
jgi:hypothetical protein